MMTTKTLRLALAALALIGSATVAAQGYGGQPQGYGAPQGDPRYDPRNDPRYDDRRDPRDEDRRDDRGPRPSATFYVQDKFNGSRLDLDHPVRSLREYNMNDAISSIDIHSGVWLVCEDDDFRGRCVTLDRSVRRLDRIGMDDKISSVRPIRR